MLPLLRFGFLVFTTAVHQSERWNPFFRASKKRFDEEDDFKLRAREAVTRLQAGDLDFLDAWQKICAVSRKEFEAIYSRLGVHVQERGESFYNPMLKVTRCLVVLTCIYIDGCTTLPCAPARIGAILPWHWQRFHAFVGSASKTITQKFVVKVCLIPAGRGG
jgi:tRNA synthetases class I (R)